jgi:hypothetical protein
MTPMRSQAFPHVIFLNLRQVIVLPVVSTILTTIHMVLVALVHTAAQMIALAHAVTHVVAIIVVDKSAKPTNTTGGCVSPFFI